MADHDHADLIALPDPAAGGIVADEYGLHVRLPAQGQIYRYEVPVDAEVVEHEIVGVPLFVAARKRDVVEFWAVAGRRLVGTRRLFTVVGTGHGLPDRPCLYRGTAIVPDGDPVWHLLELVDQ